MLHVVQTINSLHTAKGGPSRTVTQLSTALRKKRDIEISIVCSDPDIQPGINARAGNIYLKLNESIRNNFHNTIIHDNGLWLRSNFFAAIGAKRLGTPYVISPHGMMEPWAMQHRRLRKQLALALYQRWCLNNASAFHATCVEEAESIRRMGLMQPIAVIGNGIEPAPSRRVDIPATNRIALFLSRLHPKKGLPELIEAWATVQPSGWILRIVGPDDGGYRRVVEDMITDHGLTNTVQLHGEVDDQEKWLHYQQAQLFVLPTHSENFGLVIGEALAAGLPVITTTGTPWKNISTRGCGWIINANKNELAQTLRVATTLSVEQLRAMGSIGAHWIPVEFSWGKIAEQMSEFYSWVSNNMPAPTRPSFIFNG